jgi:hypothetical protein
MALQLRIDTVDVSRLANLIASVGKKAPVAIARALNHTGNKARTAMIKSLTAQTGLKRKTIAKALKTRRAAQRGDLAYTITSRGGDISLKYFKPREARGGVAAYPLGRRKHYPDFFMKSGRSKRYSKDFIGPIKGRRLLKKLGGHVYQNVEGGAWTGKMELQDSGVVIPEQMVTGATEQAFYDVAQRDLADRLGHELLRVLDGK